MLINHICLFLEFLTFYDCRSLQAADPDVQITPANHLRIIHCDLAPARRRRMAELIHRLTKEERITDPETLVSALKRQFDKAYGPCWNVVVTQSPFWSRITHVEHSSFYFHWSEFFFMIWKTFVPE